MKKLGCLIVLIAIVGIAYAMLSTPAQPENPPAPPDAAPPGAFDVVMLYGSEKQAWVEEVTTSFNARREQQDGKPIHIRAVPIGSGEAVEEVLTGRTQAHILSPASAAFIALANARSRTQTGKDLVPQSDNVVLSPVVIALWKPMAEALGWPAKRLGWSDILAMAGNPQGWGAHGMPQWGRFRFGHTHPEFSNSGLQSLFAITYAGTGKVADLTLADLARPETAAFIKGIEASVVHYGSSTGFFAKRMFGGGPGYLSAAVLYENLVIEANSATPRPTLPVVAIYPREGTFWSDHPTGIVDRPWTTPAHRAAARRYIDFLLSRPSQEAALRFGFRPADVAVALGAPVDAAHGVDPAEPKTTLATPSAEVMDASLRLWKANKKQAHVVLAIDVSGSMQDDGKMDHAREAALDFVRQLDDADRLSILPFNATATWAARGLDLGRERARAEQVIGGLFAGGGTALYDAVCEASAALKKEADSGRIAAVVVLSDGADTAKTRTLAQALAEIGSGEGGGVRLFTIAYGKDASGDVLKQLAEATQAKGYKGDTSTIRAVFRDIATFF